MNLRKLTAFTLAETLIVMGVIGIVFALTLPNLNSSTGEKEKVAKVKKLYQNFNDAVGRATVVYGPFDEWFQNDTTVAAQSTRFGERMTEFMKVSINCGIGNSTGCFSSVDGQGVDEIKGSNVTSAYFYVLSDGTSVGVKSNTIYVDIDGTNKGPSETGKDVFAFDVSDKGEVSPYGSTDFSNSLLTCGCFDRHGIECTMWVVENDNMDYLKCPDKLTANKTSCK